MAGEAQLESTNCLVGGRMSVWSIKGVLGTRGGDGFGRAESSSAGSVWSQFVDIVR